MFSVYRYSREINKLLSPNTSGQTHEKSPPTQEELDIQYTAEALCRVHDQKELLSDTTDGQVKLMQELLGKDAPNSLFIFVGFPGSYSPNMAAEVTQLCNKLISLANSSSADLQELALSAISILMTDYPCLSRTFEHLGIGEILDKFIASWKSRPSRKAFLSLLTGFAHTCRHPALILRAFPIVTRLLRVGEAENKDAFRFSSVDGIVMIPFLEQCWALVLFLLNLQIDWMFRATRPPDVTSEQVRGIGYLCSLVISGLRSAWKEGCFSTITASWDSIPIEIEYAVQLTFGAVSYAQVVTNHVKVLRESLSFLVLDSVPLRRTVIQRSDLATARVNEIWEYAFHFNETRLLDFLYGSPDLEGIMPGKGPCPKQFQTDLLR